MIILGVQRNKKVLLYQYFLLLLHIIDNMAAKENQETQFFSLKIKNTAEMSQ
jgi:hypothetical protein